MYHIPFIVQCICELSDERGEDGGEKERTKLPGGWERVEIACALVCR